MAVFVPVSAVESATSPTPVVDIQQEPSESELAPLVAFLQDHFIQGGYRGGKMVADFMQTIQHSADTGKNEFVRKLPVLAGHLRDMPVAFRDLFSEDPRSICEVERRFGNFLCDIASATKTGVLLGISKLVSTTLPFSVAAGAVAGAAVGSERLDTLILSLRAIAKED